MSGKAGMSVGERLRRARLDAGRTLDQARDEIGQLATSTPAAKDDVELMLEFLARSTRGIAR